MRIMTLDVGGTAVKSGVYCDGTLEDIREYPTEAIKGGGHVASLIETIIQEYEKTHKFTGIGVSTAGQVDSVRGRIIYANDNIPGYTGMEIRSIIEDRFGKPAAVINDVNAAALGEARYGAGQGEKDFICLTYGTGVGGAVFVQGKLYEGSSFSAGEAGAIVVHPEDRDPQRDIFSGCYERYASVTALVKKAQEFDSRLVNGRVIFEEMERSGVRQIVEEWIREIVYGLTSLIHVLNPTCIILGGGVMEQEYVLERVRELLGMHLMESYRKTDVKRALLGNCAGMYGAAAHLIETGSF
mgnify:CR=1 FL=1